MDVRIGDHRFSLIDARRTVAEAIALLDGYGGNGPHAALASRRERLAALIGAIDAWEAPADDIVRLLPPVWAELTGARHDLAETGLLPTTAEGTVVGLHLGDGGVPKRPAESITVDHDGVVGDRQGTRRHHGAPWQALCVWSEEVIAAFAVGGHPIAPGFAGENITVAGLEWGDVVPGVRLLIGDVRCEISSYAVPCRQNAPWFSDGDYRRIHHEHGPVSRLYATVLEPGSITVGDRVVLEPA